MIYLCKFGQNLSIQYEDGVQTSGYADANADGIRTKNNMSPHPHTNGGGGGGGGGGHKYTQNESGCLWLSKKFEWTELWEHAQNGNKMFRTHPPPPPPLLVISPLLFRLYSLPLVVSSPNTISHLVISPPIHNPSRFVHNPV